MYLWYVLAEANALEESADLAAGTTLTVPEVKTSSNDVNTFKPYNPSEITGPTSPGLPYIEPPDKGCGTLGMIIMIIVIIVVTVYTAGAASGAASGAAGAAGGTTAAGGAAAGAGAAATGGAAAVGTTTSVWGAGLAALSGGGGIMGVGTAIASAAIGGAVGSIAGQAVGSAMGVASFSWRNALVAGATSAATAGLGNFASGWNTVARAASSAVVSNVTSYAASKAVGNDASFSWRSVAASAISAAISTKLGQTLGLDPTGGVPGGSGEFWKDVGNGLIGGAVNLHTRRAFGFDDSINYGNIAADAFGNALGNAAVRGLRKPTAAESLAESMNRTQADLQAKLDVGAAEAVQARLDAMGTAGLVERDILMPIQDSGDVDGIARGAVGRSGLATTSGSSYGAELHTWAEAYRKHPEAQRYAYMSDPQLQGYYNKLHPQAATGTRALDTVTLDTMTVDASLEAEIAAATLESMAQREAAAAIPAATYRRNDLGELTAIGDFALSILAPTVRQALHNGTMPTFTEQYTGPLKYAANTAISLWNASTYLPSSAGGVAKLMGYDPTLTEFKYTSGELTMAGLTEAATLGVGGWLGASKNLGYIGRGAEVSNSFHGLSAAEKWGDVAAADIAVDFGRLNAVPNSAKNTCWKIDESEFCAATK